MVVRVVQFLAILLMALVLVPSGAHVFELPNKIALGKDQYFIVQNIYRGWSLFGFVMFAALLADGLLAVTAEKWSASFWFAVVAAASLLISLAIFFSWTYPANVATANWTEIPTEWQRLRTNWEYAHAASAAVTFLGFCAVTLSVMTARR